MEAIIVGALSLIGTLVGTLSGIITSNRLTNYRITKLEEKVDKHNNLIDRMYEVEKHNTLIDEEIKNIKRRM